MKFRRKVVNTNSTPNFNRTSLNSIIWKAWKLKKRLTRLNGASDRMLRIFYCLPTVNTNKPWKFYQIPIKIKFSSFITDKTIKLWKVFEKSLKVVAENNLNDGARPQNGRIQQLKLPKLTHHDTIIAAVPRKVYANAHAYHINSISINSDGETYISADDLRINLWNLNISDQSFSILF